MTNTSGKSLKERLGVLGVGLTANFLIVQGFDYVLYPFVMWYFGTLPGAAVMWVLSFLICYGTIVFYDWAKQDWLGIETLKEVRDADEEKGFFHKVMQWAMRRGDWAVMLILSIKFDPFICTVYMRHGAHQYNGMSKRDWRIFLLSFVIANLYWSIAVFTGLEIGEWLLATIPVSMVVKLIVVIALLTAIIYAASKWDRILGFVQDVLRGVREDWKKADFWERLFPSLLILLIGLLLLLFS